MKIPFSQDQFLNVFGEYNTTVWPIQLLFYFLAITAVVSLVRNGERSSRGPFLVLTFLWIWMGLVYQILFFSIINKAALLFGALFLIQAALFLYFGVFRQSIPLQFKLHWQGVTGAVFIVYALVLYPILGLLLGHVYPKMPTFGVPCPTTIFTFGVLLFAADRVPPYIFILPFLWSIIGFFAAVNLSMAEDYGLFVAGLTSFIIFVFFKPKTSSLKRASQAGRAHKN